jgi:hypothetical protein
MVSNPGELTGFQRGEKKPEKEEKGEEKSEPKNQGSSGFCVETRSILIVFSTK